MATVPVKRRRPGFADAIIKVARGLERERAWAEKEILGRLSKLKHVELLAVHDLVATLTKGSRAGPRNRRFMTRRRP